MESPSGGPYGQQHSRKRAASSSLFMVQAEHWGPVGRSYVQTCPGTALPTCEILLALDALVSEWWSPSCLADVKIVPTDVLIYELLRRQIFPAPNTAASEQ